MNPARFRIILLSLLLGILACDPDNNTDSIIDDTQVISGTLEVEFLIKHQWIPTNRIVRVGLHVAESAQLLYQGDYFQSANVTDNKQFYIFRLSPGTYYYEAIIACLCEGDSCSGGGFPGNQFGKKHTMGKFVIVQDETTQVKPIFQ